MHIIRLILLLNILSWLSVQANPNFKTRHKPGVTRHNYKLVGQWHIKFTEKEGKSADWFLYRQIEGRPEGVIVRYQIILVNQEDYRISSSRPFPVKIQKVLQKGSSNQKPVITNYLIRLGNVFKLDVLNGVLYQVQKPKDKVIGYILTEEVY